MHKLFIAFILVSSTLFFCKEVYTQDLVVTQDEDSIRCNIKQIKNNTFHLHIQKNGALQELYIHASEVKTYKFNYFEQPEFKDVEFPQEDIFLTNRRNQTGTPDEIKKKERLNNKNRISFSAGYGERIALLPSDLPPSMIDYFEGLKKGFVHNAEVSYTVGEMHGFGLKFNRFYTDDNINVILTLEDNSQIQGNMYNSILINTIAPYYTARIPSPQHNFFIVDFGIGYTLFAEEMIIKTHSFTDNFFAEGNTLGMFWNLGYDYYITSNIVAGIQASFHTGSITKFRITENNDSYTVQLTPNEYESLWRIEALAGIRICF